MNMYEYAIVRVYQQLRKRLRKGPPLSTEEVRLMDIGYLEMLRLRAKEKAGE